MIDVLHAISQAALQTLRMPAKYEHHGAPTACSKYWPSMVADLFGEIGVLDHADAAGGLDAKFCYGQHDTSEDIDNDLLGDGGYLASAWRTLPEN